MLLQTIMKGNALPLQNVDRLNARLHCMHSFYGWNTSARNMTSNFKKHLSTVHKNVALVAKEVEQPSQKGK